METLPGGISITEIAIIAFVVAFVLLALLSIVALINKGKRDD